MSLELKVSLLATSTMSWCLVLCHLILVKIRSPFCC